MKNPSRTQTILLIILAVLLCLILAVGAYTLWLWLRPSGGEPTPTPTLVGADNSWSNVQAAGKLVAGTAGDYPPFSYYNSSFQLTGFDVALIQAIGAKLGVQTEIKDFAFDGLIDAVSLGQLDAAIAAISVTPERSAEVDFSNVYMITSDAIQALAGSSIPPIQNVDQLAGYRIGVQDGSVYETWLQTSLVDTGKMPASRLFVYVTADQMITGLKENRVDVIVLDWPVANSYVQQGGFKIVGQDLNRQSYAIAVQKGANALRQMINQALVQLQSEGVINQLAAQYLNMNQMEPIPTPTPTSVAPPPTMPPPACVDGMAFIQDLTYPDYGMTNPTTFPPGTPFSKGWRIMNTGTCVWNAGYRLVYAGGNNPAAQMGGLPTAIQGTVAPGGLYDMYVNLVAPLAPGTYQASWELRNLANLPFGQRLWVGIRVGNPPSPTPKPSQTPVPGITFTATPTSIIAGQQVVFTWNAPAAKQVYLYAQGQAWQNFPVQNSGSKVDYPPATVIYELRVVNQDSLVEIRQILIQVTPVVGAPIIQQFSLNPDNQLTLGSCVQIQWQVTGDVSKVVISRNNQPLWSGAPVSGNTQDCPQSEGQYTYSIDASGPGGSNHAQKTISVIPVVQPPTVTPPAPPVPVINYFNVAPDQVTVGGCVNLNWSVGGGTKSANILRNGVVVLANAPFEYGAQDCLNQPGAVSYVLEAIGANGQSVTENRTVNVTGAPTAPIANINWAMISYDSGLGPVSTLPGTLVTALFNEDGTLAGNSGCNNYNATYTVNGNELRISQPAGGKQSCTTPEGVIQQESAYLSLLPQAASYQVQGDQLTVMNPEGRVIINYSKIIR